MSKPGFYDRSCSCLTPIFRILSILDKYCTEHSTSTSSTHSPLVSFLLFHCCPGISAIHGLTKYCPVYLIFLFLAYLLTSSLGRRSSALSKSITISLISWPSLCFSYVCFSTKIFKIWIWILLDDVYVDFCRGTSASGCPVLLFTYIHFTRSWVGLKGRPCSQS